MLRRRSLLGRVPRDGSPTSQLLLRRSDFSCPELLGSPPRVPFRPARRPRDLPGSCATLANVPRARDPGEGARPGLPERCSCVSVASLLPSTMPAMSALTTKHLSGLTLVARSPVVYASQPPSRCRPRKTHSPAAVLGFTGAGLSPVGHFERFPVATSFLLSQASPGATAFMPGSDEF